MRALLIVLDSVGVGDAPDAAAYGDKGANTLGHLYERVKGLRLPTLEGLGWGAILGRGGTPQASHGILQERSAGKDSTTGHWELAGVILDRPFAVYPRFDDRLVEAIQGEAGVEFIGNLPASGTEIIQRLGDEHVRTGKPILYTSADSVLQIAAHERIVPVERLYEICGIARRHADAYRIGRVIARPFRGKSGDFQRTAGRHDFSMKPPRTVLNAIQESGREVIAIGKTVDLFAGAGLTRMHPTDFNADGVRKIEAVWRGAGDGLVIANLVDFDTVYGHRRDPEGYARALMEFDVWLGAFLPQVHSDDLLIITADHGNDPTFTGTDHTRERVPLIVRHGDRCEELGVRATFADVAASLASFFDLSEPWGVGVPFFEEWGSNAKHDDHVSPDPARRSPAGGRDDRGAPPRGAQPAWAGAGAADGAAGGASAHPGDLLQPGRKDAADGGSAGRGGQAAGADTRQPR